MSKHHARIARLSLVAVAVTTLAACQDAVAPLASVDQSVSTPSLTISQNSAAYQKLIPGQYIVVFKSGYNDVDGRTSKLNARARGKLGHTFRSGLRGFSAGMTAVAAADLAKDPSVAFVEQDRVVSLEQGSTPNETATDGPLVATGISPLFAASAPAPKAAAINAGPWTEKNVLWNLDRIDQVSATLNKTYTYSATGAGVNVYIVDSGIRLTHVEFGGRATADYSAFNDGHDADGCFWHGTHVAGIVGGTVFGVAKNVRIHSVRVFDCNGSGSTSEILAAIEWMILNAARPAVANMSFTDDLSPAMNDAVARAVASGIVIITAAGNNTADACSTSPQSAPEAITVGASDAQNNYAYYSNFGPCVDIIAPGIATSAWSVDNKSVVSHTGSSMAAPHVAGAAAMYLQMNPTATPAEVASALFSRASAQALAKVPAGTPNLLLRTQ